MSKLCLVILYTLISMNAVALVYAIKLMTEVRELVGLTATVVKAAGDLYVLGFVNGKKAAMKKKEGETNDISSAE